VRYLDGKTPKPWKGEMEITGSQIRPDMTGLTQGCTLRGSEEREKRGCVNYDREGKDGLPEHQRLNSAWRNERRLGGGKWGHGVQSHRSAKNGLKKAEGDSIRNVLKKRKKSLPI